MAKFGLLPTSSYKGHASKLVLGYFQRRRRRRSGPGSERHRGFRHPEGSQVRGNAEGSPWRNQADVHHRQQAHQHQVLEPRRCG